MFFLKFYNLDPEFAFCPKAKDELSPFDFKRSLQKALLSHCKILLFPESLLDSGNRDSYLQQTLKEGLAPAVFISARHFADREKELSLLNKQYKLIVNMLFEFPDEIPLKQTNSFFSHIIFTCIVTKKNSKTLFREELLKRFASNSFSKIDFPTAKGEKSAQNLKTLSMEDILKNSNNIFEKTFFYFPYKKYFSDPFLTPRQVLKFIIKNKGAKACPWEIYDNRIAQDMDLEPLVLPFAENKIPSSKPVYFSIIIPAYNNRDELLNSLKSLYLQNFPKEEYEIILVDDGSEDNTRSAIGKFIKEHPNFNFKAICFPRVIERRPGDFRFRAGLARNLGQRQSRGKALLFLDADVLTPPELLNKLKEESQKADVILLKRYHLKLNAPTQKFFSDKKELDPWLFIEEKKYWGTFFKKGFNKVSSPWKYICSYGLFVWKKDFQTVGGFGRNFTGYGFEDTDLGYRLFKAGKKLYLSPSWVYHQPPKSRRQEYRANPYSRHRLLALMAKIFFYKHLDPAIYKELSGYMIQKRGLYYFFPFLKQRLI